jgi:hypothetical protein
MADSPGGDLPCLRAKIGRELDMKLSRGCVAGREGISREMEDVSREGN